MLPELIFQTTSFLLNLLIVLFVIFYLVRLHNKEKELEKKENKIDTNYHKIVDDALSKERKILDDATHAADQIITGAHYVNQNSKESVDKALEKMVGDIKEDTSATAHKVENSYQTSLDQISTESLNEFRNVAKELQGDLQKQVKQFHETLLPGLEKELEEYKQARLKQAEQTITHIIQEASQTILNKSISFEDQQKLMLESLEKAKKEGLFG